MIGGSETLALKPRDVEREEPAVLDDLPGDFVFAGGELFERDFVARGDSLDQIEVGRGQQPEVLTVLFVDSLVVFGDDQPNTGGDFRVRRGLAARSLAAPFAGNRSDEAAVLDVVALNRELVAALQADDR